MREAFLLGWKDCMVRFQSRPVLVAVIALPLAMTIVTGFAFKGLEPGNLNARVAVVVEGGPLNAEAARAIDALGAWERGGESPDAAGAPAGANLQVLRDRTAAQARAEVESQELDGAIIVPAGFSAAFAAGTEVSIELVTGRNATLKRSIVEVAFDRLVEVLRQREERPVDAVRSQVGEAQRLGNFDSFSQAVAGNGVMFILMNCMTTGGIALVRERRQNTLARLMISPMSTQQIVLGKTLGVYLVGLVQALVVFGFGAVFFRVFDGVDIVGVALITLLLILVGCALGLTISSIARREETAEALGSPTALVMTALGGGMFPVEMGPEWLERLSLFLPTGWAMKGYHDLIWDGKGTLDILPNLAVLAGFAAVFLLIGVRNLKWE